MIGGQRVSQSGPGTAPRSQLLIHMLEIERDYHENDVRKVKGLMCEEDSYEESDILPTH